MKTLTQAVLSVVQKNATRGVTVPEIVQKLNRKFPFGLKDNDYSFVGFDRQSVSSRVTDLSNTGRLTAVDTRLNKSTGRLAFVYKTAPTTIPVDGLGPIS